MARGLMKCATCNGTGWWASPACEGKGVYYEPKKLPCINCDGHGRVFREVMSTEERRAHMRHLAQQFWGTP